jgi:hypothetical protein
MLPWLLYSESVGWERGQEARGEPLRGVLRSFVLLLSIARDGRCNDGIAIGRAAAERSFGPQPPKRKSMSDIIVVSGIRPGRFMVSIFLCNNPPHA